MSESLNLKDVLSIEEVLPPDSTTATLKLEDLSILQPKPLSSLLPDISSIIPADVIGSIQGSGVMFQQATPCSALNSPNAMRAKFQQTFQPLLSNIQNSGLDPVSARKATLVATLKTMSFKITDTATVNSCIEAVFGATDLVQLNNSMKTLMQTIEIEHSNLFIQKTALAFATASNNTGFKEVTIKPVMGKLEVIAKNSNGECLLSEISLDPQTNQVNVTTEIIGVTDGTCSSIMNRFHEELRRLNVRIRQHTTTFTGGVCHLPYAQIIDKQSKEASKKKLERIRKLNNNNNPLKH